MGRFRNNNKKELPGISTASLPDIVFMLLFFFMVSSESKDEDLIVDIVKPTASEVTKIEDKSLVPVINVGRPIASLRSKFGTQHCIQLNDDIKPVSFVTTFIENKRYEMRQGIPDAGQAQELVNQMRVGLKIDKDAKMGMVGDIKEQLKSVGALKIIYITSK